MEPATYQQLTNYLSETDYTYWSLQLTNDLSETDYTYWSLQLTNNKTKYLSETDYIYWSLQLTNNQIPQILPKMQYWVSASTRVYAPIRYHVLHRQKASPTPAVLGCVEEGEGIGYRSIQCNKRIIDTVDR